MFRLMGASRDLPRLVVSSSFFAGQGFALTKALDQLCHGRFNLHFRMDGPGRGVHNCTNDDVHTVSTDGGLTFLTDDPVCLPAKNPALPLSRTPALPRVDSVLPVARGAQCPVIQSDAHMFSCDCTGSPADVCPASFVGRTKNLVDICWSTRGRGLRCPCRSARQTAPNILSPTPSWFTTATVGSSFAA